jgi:glycosyltransferase involved in cell wall biosynthesis
MRIAIAQRLTLAHGIQGGMEQQAHQLALGLQARGHTISVFTTPLPQTNRSDTGNEDGLDVHYIAPGSWRRYSRRWWSACYGTIKKMHAEQPFDLLLSQSAGALGYAQKANQELQLPIVMLIHGTLQGALRTQWRNAKDLRGIYRLGRLLTHLAYDAMLWRRSTSYVSHWIAVSETVAEEWGSELKIDPKRVSTIPNGVDTDLFRPDGIARHSTRQTLGIPQDAQVLCCVGRLEREKGIHLAIEAFQRLRTRYPRLWLLIAGDGVEREALAAQASKDPEIKLLGHLSHQKLPSILAASDIFVMPTLRDEAFPMTAVEALASGLPIVASRIGGLPSAISQGETGLLVPTGDLPALQLALAELLSEPERTASMGQAARNSARQRFDRRAMIQATERILLASIAQP